MAAQGLGVLLYLVRINHIPKPMVRYSLDMLNEARIIGVVLNSIEMHRLGSFYYAYQYPNYAYYSNAYSYGYDQYDYGDGPKQKRVRRPQRYRTQTSGLTKWFNRLFLPFK